MFVTQQTATVSDVDDLLQSLLSSDNPADTRPPIQLEDNDADKMDMDIIESSDGQLPEPADTGADVHTTLMISSRRYNL